MAKKLFYITDPRRFELPEELQNILVKSKFMQAGVDTNLSSDHIGYFNGLRDAGIKGAGKVSKKLTELGKITLVIEAG